MLSFEEEGRGSEIVAGRGEGRGGDLHFLHENWCVHVFGSDEGIGSFLGGPTGAGLIVGGQKTLRNYYFHSLRLTWSEGACLGESLKFTGRLVHVLAGSLDVDLYDLLSGIFAGVLHGHVDDIVFPGILHGHSAVLELGVA